MLKIQAPLISTPRFKPLSSLILMTERSTYLYPCPPSTHSLSAAQQPEWLFENPHQIASLFTLPLVGGAYLSQTLHALDSPNPHTFAEFLSCSLLCPLTICFHKQARILLALELCPRYLFSTWEAHFFKYLLFPDDWLSITSFTS